MGICVEINYGEVDSDKLVPLYREKEEGIAYMPLSMVVKIMYPFEGITYASHISCMHRFVIIIFVRNTDSPAYDYTDVYEPCIHTPRTSIYNYIHEISRIKFQKVNVGRLTRAHGHGYRKHLLRIVVFSEFRGVIIDVHFNSHL